jgi:hypothetical protein
LLTDLVAARAYSGSVTVFDQTQCFARAARYIDEGDLRAAERSLREDLNRHPHERSLRQFHSVIAFANARIQYSKDSDHLETEPEMLIAWLRLVSAGRTHDRSAYAAGIELMSAACPGSPISQLLQASGRSA